MPADVWENLIGSVLEGRYRLRTLTSFGRDQAEFVAEATQGGIDPLTVTLITARPEEMDALRSQLLLVSRLQHPNLVRILSAGESAVEGQFMLYLASETPDQTLAAALASGHMPEDAVRELALHVLGALSFLHEQGFGYRSLDPQTVVRVNGRWKLADFGQVCPLGEPSAEPPGYTSPYLPPEAKTGPVRAAWDIWALGVLMREALTGQVTKVSRLPRPFDDIVAGCLQPQPERRLSAEEIRQMLALGSPASSGLAAQAVAKPQPRNEAPAASVVQTHYSRTPSAGNVWRWLRILALVALACVAVLLPFGWRKKKPVRAKVPAAATAPSAPAGHAAPVQAPPSRQAPKSLIVKAGYISSGRNGRRTASGERFDSNSLTAATRAYPIGTRLRVTNLENGTSVVVRVNDRDRRGRFIGLTKRAARELGIARAGTAQVMLEVEK